MERSFLERTQRELRRAAVTSPQSNRPTGARGLSNSTIEVQRAAEAEVKAAQHLVQTSSSTADVWDERAGVDGQLTGLARPNNVKLWLTVRDCSPEIRMLGP